MSRIENIVFKGGGVLGLAYAGAIETLEKEKWLKKVKRCAGTSAGAVAALMLSLKYSAKEIKRLLEETDFESFQDHFSPWALVSKYGLYQGAFITEWVEDIIYAKTGIKQMTFNDLRTNGYLDLKVFACDLNEVKLQEFSWNETPNVKICEAIRASMSIPLFFQAFTFPDRNPNNHIYIDGGVLYNFPFSAFEDESKTIGLFIKTDDENTDLEFNQMSNYIRRLFITMMKGQDIDVFNNKSLLEQVIIIDSLQIPSTKFDLTQKEKKALYQEGKKSAKMFCDDFEQGWWPF